MTEKHPLLQVYEEARENYDRAESLYGDSVSRTFWERTWAEAYGLYKIARYNAVRAGLIPEQPQFDEVAG